MENFRRRKAERQVLLNKNIRANPVGQTKNAPVVCYKRGPLLGVRIVASVADVCSRTEATAFRALASRFASLPFDEAAGLKAAEIRAELLRLGR